MNNFCLPNTTYSWGGGLCFLNKAKITLSHCIFTLALNTAFHILNFLYLYFALKTKS